MQKPKSSGIRSGPSATAQKAPFSTTLRPARQPKPTGSESGSSMSNSSSVRSPTAKSPKPVDKKASRSPSSEKKPVSRMSKLETQLTQMQEDLQKTKNLLNSTELSKNQALEEASEVKKQYQAIAADLENTKRQLLELSDKHDLEVDSEPKPLELTKPFEKEHDEVEKLEADYGELVSETHLQLQVANTTIQSLHSDGLRVVNAFKTACSELEAYKSHASSLESENDQLKLALIASDAKFEEEHTKSSAQIGSAEETIFLLKDEIGHLKKEANARIAELVAALTEKSHDLAAAAAALTEKDQRLAVVAAANESLKFEAEKTEEEVTAMKSKLNLSLAEADELKAKLATKEAQLLDAAAASEASKDEILKLAEIQRKYGIETESALKEVAELKENLMDKETELQSISEENKALRAELQKKVQEIANVRESTLCDLEAAKASQKDAVQKLERATDDAEKSNQRAREAAEQLQAARAANSDMEDELKRMRVQTEQWRKAAEAAATILNSGTNGKLSEKSGPIETEYVTYGGKVLSSPYSEDHDGDSGVKTKKTMLKKIGVLWKKGQK